MSLEPILTAAVNFAREAFVQQGMDMTPVAIVRGSGSDYTEVAHVGPYGVSY